MNQDSEIKICQIFDVITRRFDEILEDFEFGAVRRDVESFGLHFFAAGELKLQRNRGMHQIPIRKRTFFICSVHTFFKNP